ncbi:MAG: PBP1A family penicillin-binding protein [Proteobacteria bacterium]|nr:PBP1A family penicillin-binding protein [Pseudomonadota bacterium]
MSFIRSGGVRIALAATALAVLVPAVGIGLLYVTFLTDLPDLQEVEDYRPSLTTRVLDREGRLIGEFFAERRQLAPIETIPRHTQLAFVSSEDSSFYEHGGIDYESILRAAWIDVTAGEIKQGASTITMQLVKQLLLSPERRFRRKIREMILARQLEQNFTKDEILFLYLNHIYFGQGAHGIAEAAYTYFDRAVGELSVSESALLAGLPQRPSEYSPFRNPAAAESRRRYVLGRMRVDGVLDDDAYFEAMADVPELRPPEEREHTAAAQYFTEEVRRYLFERLGGDRVLRGGLLVETTLDLELQEAAVAALRKGLEDHDKRQGYRGPIRRVEAAAIEEEILTVGRENELVPEEDPDAEVDAEQAAALELAEAAPEPLSIEPALEELADEEAALALEQDVDAYPLLPYDTPLLAVVTEVDLEAQTAQVAFAPEIVGQVALADVAWAHVPDPKARHSPVVKIRKVFAVGDVAVFVRLEPDPEAEVLAEDLPEDTPAPLPRVTLHQRPIVQGALFSLDVATGDVLAMVGGYDFEESEFNRVTQAKRQPGSAFKPFIYGAALSRGYTPVATLYDRPIVYEDPISGFVWRPQNYSRHFFGPLPMRTALVRSINNATVHLFRDVGVDFVIDYARRLGIEAPLNRDLSLALGSSDVTLLELTTAYSVFTSKGRRVVPRFINRVTDMEGNVLLEDVPIGKLPAPVLKPLRAESDEGLEVTYPDGEILPTDQIISEAAAYLMCDLLKGVVKDPRGTGWRLRQLGRPVAGKTGTTNDQFDAWFVGFSPEIATGVWVGHDESRVLGRGETGSRAAAPIWVQYMATALADRPVRDFEVPDKIVFQRIDRETGLLADAGSQDAYFQPFLENTQPTETTSTAVSATDTQRALREDSF